MNRNILRSLPALLLVALMALSSCRREDDPDPFDTFIGDYNVNDNCTGGQRYTLTLAKASNNRLIIVNLLDSELSFDATISGNTLTIPSQTKGDSNFSITVSGEGTVEGNRLTLDYDVRLQQTGQQAQTGSCSATGTR